MSDSFSHIITKSLLLKKKLRVLSAVTVNSKIKYTMLDSVTSQVILHVSKIIGIHHEYSCRIMDISPKGSEMFRQCDEALPSHLAKISDPEGEVSLSYMNKRVDGFIFSHLKTFYLSGM